LKDLDGFNGLLCKVIELLEELFYLEGLEGKGEVFV
jgi:hypothetical protein